MGTTTIYLTLFLSTFLSLFCSHAPFTLPATDSSWLNQKTDFLLIKIIYKAHSVSESLLFPYLPSFCFYIHIFSLITGVLMVNKLANNHKIMIRLMMTLTMMIQIIHIWFLLYWKSLNDPKPGLDWWWETHGNSRW